MHILGHLSDDGFYTGFYLDISGQFCTFILNFKSKTMRILNHEIHTTKDAIVLWDKDEVEFKNEVLYCKDIIINPNFSIKGGIITCRNVIFED